VIVLDSSVLVGIINGEADAARLFELLASDECAIAAPTPAGTGAWCSINLAARSSSWLEISSGPGAARSFLSAAR
jgi:uncharacterized protein with PIN domain